MTTEQLRYFLAVARYKNFTKAAEKLYIGQPALSRQIADLEGQFGRRLFARSSRGVELTPAGRVLQKEAESLIEQLDRVSNCMQEAEAGEAGSLRIATVGNVSQKMSDASRCTISVLRNLDIRIGQGTSSVLTEQLLVGEQDLILTFLFSVKYKRDIVYREVDRVRYVAVLPAEHPLVQKEELLPEDMQPYRKVILNNEELPEFSSRIISPNELIVEKRSIRVGSWHEALQYIDVGAGIGFMPAYVFPFAEEQSKYRNLVVRSFSDPACAEEIVLAWRESGENNPVLKKFVKCFCEYALGGEEIPGETEEK